MSDAKRRLKRLEAQVRKLPVSENERRAAEERHRCRFTVILEIKRYVMHRLLTPHGNELPPYEPFIPQGESLENVRAHHERWRLPVVSEKSPEEAQAYLGGDNRERARQDEKIVGWYPWVEEEYIPALEAMAKVRESGNRSHGLEWVSRNVEAEAEEGLAGRDPRQAGQERAKPDHHDRIIQRHLAKKKRAAERRTRGEGGKGLAE